MSTLRVNTIQSNTGTTVSIHDTVLSTGGALAAVSVTTSGFLDVNGLFTSFSIEDNQSSVIITTPIVSQASIICSGAISGANISGSTVTSTGAVNAVSVAASGAVTANTLVAASSISVGGNVLTATSPAIFRGWAKIVLTYNAAGTALASWVVSPAFGLTAGAVSALTGTLTITGAVTDGTKLLAVLTDNTAGASNSVFPYATVSSNTITVNVASSSASAVRTVYLIVTNPIP